MSRLRAIQIEGYRCFVQPTRLELRPLTLLYGRNNSGKSALVRLLPILAESTREGATSPFDITSIAGKDVGFLSALSKGLDLKRLEISLEWGTSHVEWVDTFELKYIDERDAVSVAEVRIEDGDGAVVFEASSHPYPDDGLFFVSG